MARKSAIPILPAALTGCKRGHLLFLAALTVPAVISCLFNSGAAQEQVLEKSGPEIKINPAVDSCRLRDGKVFIAGAQGISVLPLEGSVLRIFRTGDDVYYIRECVDPGGDVRWTAGCINIAGGPAVESVPLALKTGDAVVRLSGGSGVVFLLAAGSGESPDAGTFYRIELNGGAVSTRGGIADFTLCGGAPVFIEMQGDVPCLNVNGSTLPLSVKGRVRITENIDGRMLFLSSGDETEIVDCAVIKSVCLYSRTVQYKQPADHNLIVEITDNPADGEIGEHVFYKVFIDGNEAGRTDTGPAGAVRTFRVQAEHDRNHTLKFERWELNRGREKYDRVNNIRQPAPVRVYLPSHLVVKISGNFDGKTYIFHTGPVVEK